MSFEVCGINHSVLSILWLFVLCNSDLGTFFKNFTVSDWNSHSQSGSNDSWPEECKISEKKVNSVLLGYAVPPPPPNCGPQTIVVTEIRLPSSMLVFLSTSPVSPTVGTSLYKNQRASNVSVIFFQSNQPLRIIWESHLHSWSLSVLAGDLGIF